MDIDVIFWLGIIAMLYGCTVVLAGVLFIRDTNAAKHGAAFWIAGWWATIIGFIAEKM